MTDTHTERPPGEDEGRHWGDASRDQRAPKIASKPPGTGGEAGADPLTPLRKNQPYQGPDLGLLGSTPVRQYVCVLGHLAFGALGDESRRRDNGPSLVLEVRAELHSQGHHLLVLLPQASHSKPLSILFSYFTWD